MAEHPESLIRRYRERKPVEIVKAFLYDGSFPLEFLAKGESVKAAVGEGEGTCKVYAAHGGVLATVCVGEWLLRLPSDKLQTYTAEGFEAAFEPTEDPF